MFQMALCLTRVETYGSIVEVSGPGRQTTTGGLAHL
jgi:hypothetical protein